MRGKKINLGAIADLTTRHLIIRQLDRIVSNLRIERKKPDGDQDYLKASLTNTPSSADPFEGAATADLAM